MPQTVLIVDDHAGFRGFARRLLEAGGYTVVGEANDGASAVAAVEELRPELVLLDVMLPDTDGFAEAADFGLRLERTSARGFIHKDELSPAALARLTAEAP